MMGALNQAPLTPANCDVGEISRVPLDLRALQRETLTHDASAFRAHVNLLLSAWHQRPAASIPDDPEHQAALAGLSRGANAMRTWRRISPQVLAGFVRCADGRLYHRALAVAALEAWLAKLGKQRAPHADAWALAANIGDAAMCLERLNTDSAALPRAWRRINDLSRHFAPTQAPRPASGAPEPQQRAVVQ